MKDTYRQAASMLLLRPGEDGGFDSPELLLLHKPRKRDSWQLPQGGMEKGETIEECARRELMEEAGLKNISVDAVSSTLYEYDFPSSFRRFRPDHICGQQIHFVIASTNRTEVVQVDENEIDTYVWIKPSKLQKYIKRKEYLALVRHLLEEAKSLHLTADRFQDSHS